MKIISRYYCPNCGSQLYYKNEKDAQERTVVNLDCDNEYCFIEELKLHHPFEVIKGTPPTEQKRGEDSFSLSFIN